MEAKVNHNHHLIKLNTTDKLAVEKAIGAVGGKQTMSTNRMKCKSKDNTAPTRELAMGQATGGNNSSQDGTIFTTTKTNIPNLSPTI